MLTNSHQKRRFYKYFYQLIGIVSFWCAADISWSRSCPDQTVGVHETRTTSGVTYISVAKVTALSELEGSVELARAEARVLAKHQIIERLNASTDHVKNISGAIDISTCVAGQDIFSKIVVTANSIRQASKLNDAMTNSIIKIPTPTP